MSKSSAPVVSVQTPSGPLVELKGGTATFAFLKWLQNIGQIINKSFTNQGQLSPDSIPFPTSTALGGVTTAGPVDNEFISAIGTDGVPVLDQPSFSNISGVAVPSQLPPLGSLSGNVSPSQVPPLSDLNGQTMAAQVPNLEDLNGAVTPAQVPALSDLSGNITTSQLPPSGITVVIVTAKLTGGGADGSQTFTNGILTAQVPAT